MAVESNRENLQASFPGHALCLLFLELWPDIEVAECLDAVAGFGRDDYVMSEAEAEALRDTTQARSSIKGNPLPSRKK